IPCPFAPTPRPRAGKRPHRRPTTIQPTTGATYPEIRERRLLPSRLLGGFALLGLSPLPHRRHRSFFQGANISCNTVSTAEAVLPSILPSLLISRDRSTVRIWSSTTCPSFPLNRQDTRVGYGWLLVVRGAMITVRTAWLISSGETTTHGRVF